MKKLQRALFEYLDRKDRRKRPDGTFDNKKRWYPSSEERKECCDGIRGPSATYPFSYMAHCRRSLHVAHLYSVDPEELNSIIHSGKLRRIKKATQRLGQQLTPEMIIRVLEEILEEIEA